MTIKEYQKLAMRTATEDTKTLLHASLGLAGESGEVADIVKKVEFHGHNLNREDLIKELGDVCWYIALACECLDTDMEELFKKNIDKLKKRYPDGFDTEKSKNREEYKPLTRIEYVKNNMYDEIADVLVGFKTNVFNHDKKYIDSNIEKRTISCPWHYIKCEERGCVGTCAECWEKELTPKELELLERGELQK